MLADPDKVEQVLTNLVENAAKYADPARVRIIAAAADDESVTVAVADHGAGIGADDLPRVFDRFFRRDHGRPTGTGLGLWISRRLAEAHGGSLTATSVEGEGTHVPLHACPLGADPTGDRPYELAARSGDPSLFADHDRRDRPAHRGRRGRVPRPPPTSTSCRSVESRAARQEAARSPASSGSSASSTPRSASRSARPSSEAQRTVEAVLRRAPRRARRGRPPRAARGRAASTSPRCGPAATPGTSTSSPR